MGTNSSFYADGGVYDEATVVSNDTPSSTSDTHAPSSMYPSGTIYDELIDTNVVAEAEASAAAAAASATAAAASLTSAAAILATLEAELTNAHFLGDLTVDGHITAGGYINSADEFRLAGTVALGIGGGLGDAHVLYDAQGNERIFIGSDVADPVNYETALGYSWYSRYWGAEHTFLDDTGLHLQQNTASTNSTTGALRVTGGAGIGGDIFGGASINAATHVSAAASSTQGFWLGAVPTLTYQTGYHQLRDNAGNLRIEIGPAGVDATTYYENDLHWFLAADTVTSLAALDASGLALDATTASTSTTTGALRVPGGAGIGGSVYVGEDIHIGNARNLFISGADSGIDLSNGTGITRRSSDGHMRFTSQNSVFEFTGTGSVTGPTAAVDTNSPAFATTAYVLAQAGASNPLIPGTAAPGTSLRWSRQDHVHPTDTTRAALASPAFTGTPSVPNATVDTNTTQIANTAFVLAQAASATPLVAGTAAVGTSTRFARGDHVHPSERSATSALGYATGAGGAVTQLTSKATGVTLSKLCGQITTAADALAAGATASFIVTNTNIAATDVVAVSVQTAGTSAAYAVNTSRVVAGSFMILLRNNTAGSLSEAVVINFAVIKAVNA